MAKRKETVWGSFDLAGEKPPKDDKDLPTSVKQWLQWLAGELAACMAQGVYVGIVVTSLGDLGVTLVNDGNKEKIYLEASEGIGEQTSQMREALGQVTRRRGSRAR